MPVALKFSLTSCNQAPVDFILCILHTHPRKDSGCCHIYIYMDTVHNLLHIDCPHTANSVRMHSLQNVPVTRHNTIYVKAYKIYLYSYEYALSSNTPLKTFKDTCIYMYMAHLSDQLPVTP